MRVPAVAFVVAVVCWRVAELCDAWNTPTYATTPRLHGKASALTVFEGSMCMLLEGSGSVRCWANPAMFQYSNPRPGDGVYLNDVYGPYDDVAVGEGFVCAVVRATGGVVCEGWIENVRYEARIPMDFSSAAVAGVRAVKVFASRIAACAKMDDGSLVCWGSTNDGNLPLSYTDPDPYKPIKFYFDPTKVVLPTQCQGKPIVLFVLGQKTTIVGTNTKDCNFILGTASLTYPPNTWPPTVNGCGLWTCKMWGVMALEAADDNPDYIYDYVAFSTNVAYSSLASNHTVYVYGRNDHGQLGLGMAIAPFAWAKGFSMVPVPETAGVTEKLGAGDSFWCFLHRVNRTVHCTGSNQYGQLGQGDTTERSSPAMVNLGRDCARVKDMVVQTYHVCVVCSDSGFVKCWGYGAGGRLGPWNRNNDNWGNATGQMGDNLPSANVYITQQPTTMLFLGSGAPPPSFSPEPTSTAASSSSSSSSKTIPLSHATFFRGMLIVVVVSFLFREQDM